QHNAYVPSGSGYDHYVRMRTDLRETVEYYAPYPDKKKKKLTLTAASDNGTPLDPEDDIVDPGATFWYEDTVDNKLIQMETVQEAQFLKFEYALPGAALRIRDIDMLDAWTVLSATDYDWLGAGYRPLAMSPAGEVHTYYNTASGMERSYRIKDLGAIITDLRIETRELLAADNNGTSDTTDDDTPAGTVFTYSFDDAYYNGTYKEAYDDYGYITEVVYPASYPDIGKIEIAGYHGVGRPAEVKYYGHPSSGSPPGTVGQWLYTCKYDPVGNLIEKVMPTGDVITYFTEAPGEVKTVFVRDIGYLITESRKHTVTLSTGEIYVYDDTDAHDNGTTATGWGWDDYGNLISEFDPATNTFTVYRDYFEDTTQARFETTYEDQNTPATPGFLFDDKAIVTKEYNVDGDPQAKTKHGEYIVTYHPSGAVRYKTYLEDQPGIQAGTIVEYTETPPLTPSADGDQFGWKIMETRPDGTYIEYPLTDYHAGGQYGKAIAKKTVPGGDDVFLWEHIFDASGKMEQETGQIAVTEYFSTTYNFAKKTYIADYDNDTPEDPLDDIVAGTVIEYYNDALNRQKKITYPDGSSYEFTYFATPPPGGTALDPQYVEESLETEAGTVVSLYELDIDGNLKKKTVTGSVSGDVEIEYYIPPFDSVRTRVVPGVTEFVTGSQVHTEKVLSGTAASEPPLNTVYVYDSTRLNRNSTDIDATDDFGRLIEVID
ncbi:hypothetical protein ACFL42_05260, partial [Candidatus Omnitrophota bacterium]